MDAVPDAARSFWETDRWGLGKGNYAACLRPPSLGPSSLFVFLASHPKTPSPRKEGREERRGEVTNGFSLRFSGRRASGRLPSHPPSRIARISGIFPPPTITGVDNASNGGGGGGALWFFCSFRGHSVRRNASRESHMATLALLSLSLLVGCCIVEGRRSKVMFFALFAFRAFSPSSSCLAAFSQHNRPRPSAIPGIFPRMSGISSLTILAIFERLSPAATPETPHSTMIPSSPAPSPLIQIVQPPAGC